MKVFLGRENIYDTIRLIIKVACPSMLVFFVVICLFSEVFELTVLIAKRIALIILFLYCSVKYLFRMELFSSNN